MCHMTDVAMAPEGHDCPQLLSVLMAWLKPNPDFLVPRLKLAESFGSQNQNLKIPKADRGK